MSRSRAPDGRARRAGPGGPLQDDQGAGREPATVTQRREHPLHLAVRRRVGRVGEDHVTSRATAGTAGEPFAGAIVPLIDVSGNASNSTPPVPPPPIATVCLSFVSAFGYATPVATL